MGSAYAVFLEVRVHLHQREVGDSQVSGAT